jgi:Ca2+-binding EF-hand superfamily protein
MNINLTLEEILELFNFIDEKDANRITKTQFKESMSYLMNKMGGQNLLESSQCAKNILATRKKVQNTQIVFKIMAQMCDDLSKRQFTVKQLMLSMDLNKTGYITRPEFATWMNSLIVTLPLESVRQMANFFDHK